MYSVQGSTLFDKISVFVIYVFCTWFSSVIYVFCTGLSSVIYIFCTGLSSVIYVFCTGLSSVIMYSVQGWALLLCILYRVELYYYVFCTGLSSPNFINNEKTWWNEVNLVQRTRLFNSFCYFQKFKSFSVNRDNVQVSVNRIKV